MISPQTTRFPASRVASARGVVLPLGTGPSTGRAVSGMMVGSRCSLSRMLTFRRLARSCMASSYCSISWMAASRWRLTSWVRTRWMRDSSPWATVRLPVNSTWQATPNQAWMRPWSFSPVPRAASRS